MTKYSVLLESYSPLPFIAWADEVEKILGMHRQDVILRLRRQQGIVWEHLDREKADMLGSLLISYGYPAGLVEDSDVVRLPIPTLSKNADPVEGGFELEDLFSDLTLINAESIEFMQAGWVEEKVEVGTVKPPRSRSGLKYSADGTRAGSFMYTRMKKKEPIGWVLHVFQKGEPLEWLRIIGRNFNYDYQPVTGVYWMQRFGLLLTDLARITPFASLDEGFKETMGSDGSNYEFCSFDSIVEMEERARWQLTMLKIVV